MHTMGKALIILASVLFGLQVFGSRAYSHGFGERYDLPIPLVYFIVGAAAAVAISFLVIGWFLRQSRREFEYPRIDLYRTNVFRIALQFVSTLLGVFAVLLLVLTVVSGLFGTANVLHNFAPTFVWIIWWVGFGYVVAIFGNVWAFANPWQVVFVWGERLLGRQRGSMFSWPDKWDAWPALLMFVIFAWVENVYGSGSRPLNLSILILLYTTYTWLGMFLFGRHTWLKRGDPLAIIFALFARFSFTEARVVNREGQVSPCHACRSGCAQNSDLWDCIDCYECWELAKTTDRQLCLRPWAAGLARGESVSDALVVFYVTILATVTFDGFAETWLWVSVQTFVFPFVDPLPGPAVSSIHTMGILLAPALFAAVYFQICEIVSRLSGLQMSAREVARSFVFSLVPIALAYNLSHYLSFLLITGQQIVPLASNPLGLNWDLFGTVDYRPNIAVIDARFAWIVSATSLVAGHIVSVFIAHVIALRRTTNHRVAVRSQYPMLGLMLFYTGISLWIVAQPIVE